MIEPLLLTTVRISTYRGHMLLTGATGFFFESGGRLYLVTSRHVVADEPNEHWPDALGIELHVDADNIAACEQYVIPLYHDGRSTWLQLEDDGGVVDVVALEIDRTQLPASAVYRSFSPAHLNWSLAPVEAGLALLLVGFPLGFHDALHRTPVVRTATVASSFGLRFQGEGCFLTDARTHRGSSGAPVVARAPDGHAELGDLPWLLLGVHSSRIDLGTRDREEDEALGLNCAWYANALLPLTGQ